MTHVLAVFGADIVSLFECPSMLSTAWGANTQMHEHTYTHRLRHSRRHWTTVDHSHGQRWHCRPASAELLSNLRLCPGLHLSICSGWSWEASAFWQNVERKKKKIMTKKTYSSQNAYRLPVVPYLLVWMHDMSDLCVWQRTWPFKLTTERGKRHILSLQLQQRTHFLKLYSRSIFFCL